MHCHAVVNKRWLVPPCNQSAFLPAGPQVSCAPPLHPPCMHACEHACVQTCRWPSRSPWTTGRPACSSPRRMWRATGWCPWPGASARRSLRWVRFRSARRAGALWLGVGRGQRVRMRMHTTLAHLPTHMPTHRCTGSWKLTARIQTRRKRRVSTACPLLLVQVCEGSLLSMHACTLRECLVRLTTTWGLLQAPTPPPPTNSASTNPARPIQPPIHSPQAPSPCLEL